MSNRNEQIISFLTSAVADLNASKQLQEEAKAATSPEIRITKLTAAIEQHENALFALKNAKLAYNDIEKIVNEKLTFDGYQKIFAPTAVDKADLLDKFLVVTAGDFEEINAALQDRFPENIETWRTALGNDVNDQLTSLIVNEDDLPDWSSSDFLELLTIRATIENCLSGSSEDFAECIVALGIALINLVLDAVFVQAIRLVVGSDFEGGELTSVQLLERYQRLPDITLLRDAYGVALTGPTLITPPSNYESLGQWLSSPSADLALFDNICVAVEQAASDLYEEINRWESDYFYDMQVMDSEYINGLLAASSVETAFYIVVAEGGLLNIRIVPTNYPNDTAKLFGYLREWEYAKFARRLIEIDWEIYRVTSLNVNERASRLWNTEDWLPTANKLLRTDWVDISGFDNRGITSIDPIYSLEFPNSPVDLIQDFRQWVDTANPPIPICVDPPPVCPRPACYVSQAYTTTNNANDLAWAGAPRTDYFLPYLPKSIITSCVPARRSLAKGTIALWNEIGIYQNYEEVTRLVNALEHGNVLNTSDLRQTMFQFLHHIYHTTSTLFGSREEEYIAAMTSAIIEFDNVSKSDMRTYEFLTKMLTKVEHQTADTDFAYEYANESLGVSWETYNPNLYTSTTQQIISTGATRTFGSTEFNNLSPARRALLVDQKVNGTGFGGWVEFLPLNSTITANGAPDGVFLMTPEQHGYATNLQS